jgi:hypothetical protein
MGAPLINCIESMLLSNDNLVIHYYLKVIFRSILAAKAYYLKKETKMTVNLHTILQKEDYVDKDSLLEACVNDFNSIIIYSFFLGLLREFVGVRGMDKEYNWLRFTLNS